MRTRVAVVGAGPVGTTIANHLGRFGVETLLIDRSESIVDYPRAIGMDDECLRSMQGIGLHEQVVAELVQNVPLRFFDAQGRCFADIRPSTREFGWFRRNIFMQPLLERTLRAGLDRYPHVSLLSGHEVTGLTQDDGGVDLDVMRAGGPARLRADYVVAADGGRSRVRDLLGIPLEGATHPRKWVVIDAEGDPGDAVYTGLFCHPRRPYVCAHLPRGFRRWEFMLFPGEDAQEMLHPDRVRALLAHHVPDPAAVHVVRARVYTHHSRVASTFVRGRVALAGDAAHLMPPWAGQGMNTGIRDATNLAWKLAAIAGGRAAPALLDTYDRERRDHARAMTGLSTTLGRLLAPAHPFAARLRDTGFRAAGRLPGVKDWVLQMRFKPMPCYRDVLSDGTDPAVGRMFPQPLVEAPSGDVHRLDEDLGDWFSVIGYNQDPRAALTDENQKYLAGLDTRFVTVTPSRSRFPGAGVEDVESTLARWFEGRPPVALLRPDRYLAALTTPAGLNTVVTRLRTTLGEPS
ncbi:bifunctional 3-(3-hydroxy-phenyl)propionate/3-hydroxycinnamic acid hydroxylase [Amycolatopsis sp. NPDC004625]|uniref:bifunctional 3-(3-hydroxy-phenyl)propionate/3-hydroxycinnamic acid hydroxylase n=1 Tax=Amycolatopsis sp. NPDC004625 TaxID=3154670 RepID=UPI0033A3655F